MEGFEQWLKWIDGSGWAGFLGLLLTLAGFGITFWNLWQARTASEEAKEAANNAVLELQKLKSVTDLSSAISELDGIRRLARENSWAQLPERLSYVRKLLIGVAAKSIELSDSDAATIKTALAAFSEIEKLIESAHRGKSKLNEDRISGQLIDQIDALYDLIARTV